MAQARLLGVVMSVNLTLENLTVVAVGGFVTWLTFRRDLKIRITAEDRPATPLVRWGFRIIGLLSIAQGVIQLFDIKQ